MDSKDKVIKDLLSRIAKLEYEVESLNKGLDELEELCKTKYYEKNTTDIDSIAIAGNLYVYMYKKIKELKGSKNNEIWKDIKGYEGLYQISNLGNVKSVPRIIDSQFKGKPIKREVYEKILKKSSTKFGYDYVCLSKNGTTKKYKIHRLVGEHFIPNLENKKTINHIDGNKHNNRVDNLEWTTYKENQQHAVRTGLWKYKRSSDKE